MTVIETNNLTKIYKLYEKEAGLRGSVKSLFKRKFTHIVVSVSFRYIETTKKASNNQGN